MSQQEPSPQSDGSKSFPSPKRLPRLGGVVFACGAGLFLAGLAVASLDALKGPREGELFVRHPEKIWQPSVEGEDGSYIPPDPAKFVEFEVDNIGRTPVLVNSVETTCGCISAHIEPNVIDPGVTALVKVYPTTFPTGETRVAITLHTDSPSTPNVELRLISRGMMRPPYLLEGKGDLTFRSKSFTSESRAFVVSVVEPEGADPRLPEIRTDLPFLALSPLVLDEEGAYPGSNAIVRRYTSTVQFVHEPPGPYVSGTITIHDPWHSEHVEKLPVAVEFLPALRAAPSRVLLVAKSSSDWAASATVLVFSDEPERVFHVDVSADGPLLVQQETVDSEAKQAVFSIRLKPDLPIRDGEHHFVVTSRQSQEESRTGQITIPVYVRLETSS